MGSYAGTYAPIRDAFSDLNKMIIDKQQWDSNHEYRMQEMGLKNMLAEQQMQDQLLKREALKVEAEQARFKNEVVDVSLNDFMKPDAMFVEKASQDEGYRKNIARLYGGTDLDLASMKVVGQDGAPVKMSRMGATMRSPGLMAMHLDSIDPVKGAQANINTLNNSISGLQQELKDIPALEVNKKLIGEKRAEIAKHEAARGQYEKMMEPENLLRAYRAKESALEGWLTQAGMNGATPEFFSMAKGMQDGVKGHINNLESKIMSREQMKESKALQKDIAGMQIASQQKIAEGNNATSLEIERMKGQREGKAPQMSKSAYLVKPDGTIATNVPSKTLFISKDKATANKAVLPNDIDQYLAPSEAGTWRWEDDPVVAGQLKKAATSTRDPSSAVERSIMNAYGMVDQDKGMFNYYSGFTANHVRAAQDIAAHIMKKNPGEKNAGVIRQQAVDKANRAVEEYSQKHFYLSDQLEKDLKNPVFDAEAKKVAQKLHDEEIGRLNSDWRKVFNFVPDMSPASVKPFNFKPLKDEED